MEEASKAKKAKKGFMTPDRKKKLRVSPYSLLIIVVVVIVVIIILYGIEPANTHNIII